MAEIQVRKGSLYFYTHWSGHDLPGIARAALEAARPRIGDDAYALRIVVDTLIRDTGTRDQETGAGLMLSPDAEDEYNLDKPSVVIDLCEGRVLTPGRSDLGYFLGANGALHKE